MRGFTPGLVLVLATITVAQRSPDTLVTADSTPAAYNPVITVSGESVFVAWIDRRDSLQFTLIDNIYANRSLDGGVTWMPNDVRVHSSNARVATRPSIAASGHNVFVAWDDDRPSGTDSSIYFSGSSDGGATWFAQEVNVSSMPGQAGSAEVVACDSAVGVGWRHTTDQANPSFTDLLFSHSTDGGLTWSSPVAINTGTDPNRRPNPAWFGVEGSTVFAVWSEPRTTTGGNWATYFNRSLDCGATWLANDILIESGLDFSADVSNGVLYVKTGTAIHSTDDAGSTWQTNPLPTPTPSSGLIAADGDTVYVAWRSGGAIGDILARASADRGATWGNISQLNSGPVNHAVTVEQTVAAGDGAAHVLWLDSRSGATDIRYNRSVDEGVTWLASDIRLDTDAPGAAASNFPTVALGDDRLYVTWYDWRNSGLPRIYLNVPHAMLPFGSGTTGSGGNVPTLTGDGLSALGETVSLDIDNTLGGTAGALIVGGAQASIPVFGGTLLVTPSLAVPISMNGGSGVPGAGNNSLPLTIPVDENLVGGALFFQFLGLDSNAAGGVAMSNGLEFWIG